jgi:hypothetical protein
MPALLPTPDSPTLPALPPLPPTTLLTGTPCAASPPKPSAWHRFARRFGWRPAPIAASAAILNTAADAFTTSVVDLAPADRRALYQLLGHARSLAELWHLRPEVYRALSLQHSQAEAERRLAGLNHYFDKL